MASIESASLPQVTKYPLLWFLQASDLWIMTNRRAIPWANAHFDDGINPWCLFSALLISQMNTNQRCLLKTRMMPFSMVSHVIWATLHLRAARQEFIQLQGKHKNLNEQIQTTQEPLKNTELNVEKEAENRPSAGRGDTDWIFLKNLRLLLQHKSAK